MAYDSSAQDFVDALNHKEFPQLGYRLVREDNLSFWEFANPPHTRYAADEATRKEVGGIWN